MVRVLHRLASILAVGLAAACFVDAPVDGGPGGSGATTEAGSTGGSTTGATTTEATSESTSASASASATATATSTTDATTTTMTTTTTEGKTTTGDPTNPMTTTTTTTTGSTTEPLGWDDCKFLSDAYECDVCCAYVIAASERYFEALMPCVCANESACTESCQGNLCVGSVYSAACFECLSMIDPGCLEDAELACLTDDMSNCDDYHECKAENGCDDKP